MAESTQCLECELYLGLCRCEIYPEKIPEKFMTGLKVCKDKN